MKSMLSIQNETLNLFILHEKIPNNDYSNENNGIVKNHESNEEK